MNQIQTKSVIEALKSKTLFKNDVLDIYYDFASRKYSVELKNVEGSKTEFRKRFNENEMIEFLKERDLTEFKSIL